MRPAARRGHLLVEALCALALAGLLAAAAVSALGNARRALASTDGAGRAVRTAREAAAIVAGMLRDADSVAIHDDTAVTAAFLVATGTACHIEPSRRAVLLPPATLLGGTPFTHLAQPLEVGDQVELLVTDSTGDGGTWWGTLVDSVGTRAGASPCGPAEGWTSPADAGSARVRLALAGAVPAGVRAGAPVRVLRRGRLSLYRSGGEWMLGWRRCTPDGGTCGVAQPVAGPLLGAAQGGLRIRVDGDMLAVTARAAPSGRADSSLVAPTRGTP